MPFYIPGMISAVYLAVSNKYQSTPVDSHAIRLVTFNLILTEIIHLFIVLYQPFVPIGILGNELIKLIPFILIQESYYCIVHQLLHRHSMYQTHYIYHMYDDAYYAFHLHYIEHLILNIGSFMLAMYFVNLSEIMYNLLVVGQLYLIIYKHATMSFYARHHQFGVYGIMDRAIEFIHEKINIE